MSCDDAQRSLPQRTARLFIKRNVSAFCHHLDQIPQTELVAKVPTYAQQDHLTIKVSTCKQCLRSIPSTHPPTQLPQITLYPMGKLVICTRAFKATSMLCS